MVQYWLLIFGSYSFEFGVYPHLTIISHGFPGAGGKKEGAKSFSSYCTLYAFLRLGVSTWRLWLLFQSSEAWKSSLYPYRTSHLLIKLAGGLEYSWSIPFLFVWFFFDSNQMKRVSPFHTKRSSEFLSSPDFFCWSGPNIKGLLEWCLWLDTWNILENIAPKTRAVLVNALRIWWLYKSVNLGLSEVLEFSREMYYFLNLLMNRIQQTSWSGYRDHVNCSRILYINGTSNDLRRE